MVGYIGTRARKRRRNLIVSLILIAIFGLVIFLLPKFNTSESNLVPDDDILPDPDQEISSLSSTIEDLKLTNFQKDQKIKFRDGQINNLKNDIVELKKNFENLESNYNILQEDYKKLIELENSNQNIEIDQNQIKDLNTKIIQLNKLKKQNQNLIIEMEKELSKLKNENQLFNSNNETLRKEYKIVVSKNMKLSDLVKNFESIVKSLENKIENLKDKISHH